VEITGGGQAPELQGCAVNISFARLGDPGDGASFHKTYIDNISFTADYPWLSVQRRLPATAAICEGPDPLFITQSKEEFHGAGLTRRNERN
jgi:hypothetical protein